ncbi:DMT family transporter [Primorskyibacter aestuariivivens]|uniref:DMT family transporter n=1 Tax=Primorskyibacter aestuariivivens TaxID=1888912 RepID=UPI0023011C5A|nr:DMT family transporter [Primorskyibacter aestuariivivens]MDA7428464.1 DMT family transporter [Primorskyibacter aestuariivivens]
MTDAMRGHLAMLVFSATVAGSFSLGVLAANAIEPAALQAARFLLAGLLTGTLAIALGRVRRAHFAAPWRYFVLAAFFGTYFVLMFEGFKTAAPVSAAAVFTLTPVMAAGFGYLLMRQIMTPRIALGLAIGAAGALWVIFQGSWQALARFDVGRGEMIYFVGCVSHAVYTPLLARLVRGEPPLVFTTGILMAGSVMIGAYGWQDIVATDWASLPAIVWITLSYLVVFATAVSFMLLQYASVRLPSAKVMAYTYLTPSWVLLWELALGHGAPAVLVLAGVGMTVLALGVLLKPED